MRKRVDSTRPAHRVDALIPRLSCGSAAGVPFAGGRIRSSRPASAACKYDAYRACLRAAGLVRPPPHSPTQCNRPQTEPAPSAPDKLACVPATWPFRESAFAALLLHILQAFRSNRARARPDTTICVPKPKGSSGVFGFNSACTRLSSRLPFGTICTEAHTCLSRICRTA